MAAMYLLLPDAREKEKTWWKEANDLLRSAEVFQPPFRLVSALDSITALVSGGGVMEPDEMLALLRQIDWAYPAKLLYRTEPEDSWSFVTLGLSLRDELGGEAA